MDIRKIAVNFTLFVASTCIVASNGCTKADDPWIIPACDPPQCDPRGCRLLIDPPPGCIGVCIDGATRPLVSGCDSPGYQTAQFRDALKVIFCNGGYEVVHPEDLGIFPFDNRPEGCQGQPLSSEFEVRLEEDEETGGSSASEEVRFNPASNCGMNSCDRDHVRSLDAVVK